MKTFKRLCIKDYSIAAANGDVLRLERGHVYLTSEMRAPTAYDRAFVPGEVASVVTVFTGFWVPVPLSLFDGAMEFTA